MLRRDFLRLLAASSATAVSPGGLASAAPAGVDAADGGLVDMHSHAWRRRDFANDLRDGGMRLAVFVVTADRFLLNRDGGRLRALGDAPPGALRANSRQQDARIKAAALEAGFPMISASDEARGFGTGIVLGYEGGDMLEGALEHLQEVYAGGARLVQLAHYRVNELSDIQTEDPVHGGLTPFGKEVVRECNRLGILVDVAHATLAATQQAVEASSRPVVLSHTFLSRSARRYTRGITLEHARLVAAGGGVIGVVPFPSAYPTLEDYAVGIARIAEAVGVDHVGIGSDMGGVRGAPPLSRYRQFPLLREKLAAAGFSGGDANKVLAGNFLRVFAAATQV
jgi:membrane dipeptidase